MTDCSKGNIFCFLGTSAWICTGNSGTADRIGESCQTTKGVAKKGQMAIGSIITSIKVSNPHDTTKPITLNLLVDTGATFTVISSQDLERLGIKPRVKRRLRIADGRIVERDEATILAEIMDKMDEVPVVFGEKDDAPVIGITTLEILGFEVDPITRRLKPSEYLFLYCQDQ